MNKIFMLAFANIRKSKGHSFSILLMLIMSAFVLNMGLLLLNNYGSYFSKLSKELNTSDCYITLPEQYYSDKVLSLLKNHKNIKDVKSEIGIPKSIQIEKTELNNTEKTMIFFNNDLKREYTKKKFIGKYLPLDDNSVYLAYYFNLEWGYQLNDTIELQFGSHKKEYKIKGFIEDIYFATPDMGVICGYLTQREFQKVMKQSDIKCRVFFANLKKDIADAEVDLNQYILKNVDSNIENKMDFATSIVGIHLSTCELSRTMMASMLSVMFVTFSFIILIVCLIVIRFRIGNAIEEDMVKIGSLKAIGYTSGQIIGSIVIQFCVITVVGNLIGIGSSYPTLPFISNVLAHQSALKWEQGFDIFNSVISFFAILLFVSLISLLSAQKIKKINPIVALRGGINNHNFKKNYFPFEKTRGAVTVIIGFKSMFQNKKQSIMVAVITMTITFAGIFGLFMFYNSVIDTTAFAETPGQEICNIELDIDPSVTDNKDFLKEIRKHDSVEYAQYINQTVITIEGIAVSNVVMEDFNTKRTNMVYEGRYPIHENEIVINGNLAELIGKKIGDMVAVKNKNKKVNYLITGLQQGAMQAGKNSAMTYAGYLKLYPDFKLNELSIYLKKGRNTEKCLKEFKKEYKEKITDSWNIDKEFEDGVGTYTPIVSKVGIVMLCISVLVVFLVIYFVINSFLIRNKRSLGIQKAIGFTTFQLMNQVSLSILPSIIVGVIFGSITGALLINPIMSFVQKGMGVVKANYIILPDWAVLFGIAIILFSYMISLLLTLRIRKISAYALVTE